VTLNKVIYLLALIYLLDLNLPYGLQQFFNSTNQFY